MKTGKKIVALMLAVALFACCFMTGCKKNSDTLIVGTNAEFPPFEYLNDSAEVDGFDIALMQAIGDKLGMKVKIENMEFKGLIAALKTGKINCIAAGMTVTDERKENADFSDSYYTATQYILVPKGEKVKSMDDLKGKKIAVQEGTTGDFIATDDVENATVKRFKKGVDAVQELKNGRVDAVIIDSNPAQVFAKQFSDDIDLIKADFFEPEYYAIAVAKGDKELLEKINKALKELKEDGTYDKLVKKYIEEA